MIIGQTLLKGVTCYTPWSPRRGDSATVAVEIIGRSGGGLDPTVETKNVEEVDSSAVGATAVSAFPASITSTGVTTAEYEAFKELVRLKLEVSGGNDYDWVHVRVLDPSWLTN